MEARPPAPTHRYLVLCLTLGAFLALTVSSAPVLYVLITRWQISQFQTAYASVQEGDTISDVVAKMGPPTEAVNGKLDFDPLGLRHYPEDNLITDRSAEYVRFYRYRMHRLVVPILVHIGFDSKNRVVLKTWMD